VDKWGPIGRVSRVARAAAPAFFALLVVAALASAAPAAAQTYTVANTTDSGGANDGSLRGELAAANAHEGPDTIEFAPGVSGTITISGTGLVVKDPVDIEGPGPGTVTVRQISGGHRVFQVKLAHPGAVAIAGLTLAGGETTGPGGDIEYDAEGEPGSLTVSNCVVTEGSAADYGGGISSFGAPLTLRDSTVIENEADSGGGVWAGGDETPFTIERSTIADNRSLTTAGGLNGEVEGGGHDVIVDSTISGNISSNEGGGAFFSLGKGTYLTVANSTVAENVGDDGAGGLEISPGGELQVATIEGSTIVGNHGGSLLGEAGGVQTFGAVPQLLVDTIVADNTGGYADVYGPWAAAFSLIGDPAGGKVSESVPGSVLSLVEPRLGPLADNGGPTETMAPAPTSPVVNKGGGSLTTDQRGAPRPVIYPGVALSGAPGANGADIGAVELAAPPGVGGSPPPQLPPPPGPAPAAPAESAPRVRVNCPKTARPGGCHFALQAVSAKPRRVKGKGGSTHLVAPKPESAVAQIKLAAGKSALLTLAPKAKYATQLEAATAILVRESTTVGGKTTTTYPRLKVVR
jgi:parallel beta helix pectate lyase-like protein